MIACGVVFADTTAAERSADTQLAAPIPMNRNLKKKDLVKFIPCGTEEECFEKLQDSDVDMTNAKTDPSKGESTFFAEFVTGPKKGINIYRKQAAQ